jgi:hypothetical protein
MDANDHDGTMTEARQEIARRLPKIILGADLEKATVRTLQKELEDAMGQDLAEHKNFIRTEVWTRARVMTKERTPREFFSIWCGLGGIRRTKLKRMREF